MNTANPYNKNLTNITIIGCYDVLSLRKVSSIKNSISKYACDELHIGVVGDELAFLLQEQYPLQDEDKRMNNLYTQLKIRPQGLSVVKELLDFIQERNVTNRFIILASENGVFKDSVSAMLEKNNCVYNYEESFSSDNERYQAWLEKRRGLHK